MLTVTALYDCYLGVKMFATKFDMFLGVALLGLIGVGIWQFGWFAVWVIAYVMLRERIGYITF